MSISQASNAGGNRLDSHLSLWFRLGGLGAVQEATREKGDVHNYHPATTQRCIPPLDPLHTLIHVSGHVDNQ